MYESFGPRLRSLFAVAAVVLVSSVTAAAQTVVLNQPGTQVTDTTLRSGAYSNTNYDNQPLLTRRSNDPDWERRAILKFDTKNTIPQGARIASATLTLTIKASLGATTRSLAAFRIVEPFQEAEATWIRRQGSYNWRTPGGTIAEQFGAGLAGSAVGSTVVIDLTTLVQRTVNGEFDSRYTRVLLADSGTDSKESYREYFPSEDPIAASRPTLTVVVGETTAPSTPPPPPPPPADTVKILQWNIAQGYATDGTSNIDRIVAFIVQQRPDVISFNEIMVGSSSSQPRTIADRLHALTGDTWTYHWIQKWGAATGEGECVMTRLTIEATDDYLLTASRSVAMLRVNVNGRTLNVFSTHLDHQSSATRLAQVKQLVAWAATHMEQRIIAGDFNALSSWTEIMEMKKTYDDGWAVAKTAGTAVGYPGNLDGNTRNNRIDYVFYSKGATALSVVGAQVFDTRDAAGVRPSDHNPLIVTLRVN
jgi:endonuclease/exonuclease/phosphatase family metal-dependent hydrolase